MYVLWTVTGILFLILDFIKKSTFKLSISQSALFTAIAAYKYPYNIKLHFVVFIVSLPVFYFLFNTIIKKGQTDAKKVKTLDNFEGQVAKVVKDIGKVMSIDGIGAIEYRGEIWQAKSVSDSIIKKGQMVEIVSRENMIMNVKDKEDAKI